ncbi:MAG TPA: hypothetical protein VEX86_12265 [Longimicrobium sp.]|nr:hypothetical protein [Longimicrobium sp.]
MNDEMRQAALAAGIPRATDAAQAGDDLPRRKTEAEVADHLAELSWNDPETVFMARCAREVEYGGYLGDYVIEGGERRTLARPDAQVTLVVAADVSCGEALTRLDHIRAYLAELPPGLVLARDDDATDRATDRLARLDTARGIVLAEMAQETGSS